MLEKIEKHTKAILFDPLTFHLLFILLSTQFEYYFAKKLREQSNLSARGCFLKITPKPSYSMGITTVQRINGYPVDKCCIQWILLSNLQTTRVRFSSLIYKESYDHQLGELPDGSWDLAGCYSNTSVDLLAMFTKKQRSLFWVT